MPSVYVMDTNSLIELKRYPRDVFSSVWQFVERLVRERRVIAPHEVLREVEVGDDEIEQWARTHGEMFIDLDADQAAVLKEVLASFPQIHDPSKQGPHADPLVVALAVARTRSDPSSQYLVVTEANVCQAFGIEFKTLIEFFRQEGLRL